MVVGFITCKQSASCCVWFLCQASGVNAAYTARQSETVSVNGVNSDGADIAGGQMFD